MDIIKVKFDWNDEKSIKRAEKQKIKLENDGYILKATQCTGLETRELLYIRN